MRLSARVIYPGVVEGEALVSPMGISFFGGVDPDSGVVVERGHALEGRSVAGKVLVFPSGKGSTVGSYTLYRLKANGKAPLAIINAECETITAVGCIIAEIPCVDRVNLAALHDGHQVRVDAVAGEVQILSAARSGSGSEVRAAGPGGEQTSRSLSGASAINVEQLWERLPEPLRGSEAGTFAEHTFVYRLPGIVRRILEAGRWPGGEWPDEIRAGLQALIQDLPHGQLRPLIDTGAADLAQWQEWMERYYGQTWLTAPWLLAETYFFRRVLEATQFFQPGPGYGADPYREDKLEGLRAAVQPLAETCETLASWEKIHPLPETLMRLLHQVVWGNQADLSVFPASEEGPNGAGADHLLVDQAGAAADYLAALQGKAQRVDILFDNGGLELAFDLLLVDFLLEHGLAGKVVVHAKPFPTYVSDVTIPDLHETLEFLGEADDGRVRAMAQRLQAHLKDASMTVASELHWAGALVNWQMPDDLRNELSGSALIISKGDMNYRRWLGDLHWPFSTPFENITAYRPAPLLALRVFKSNVLAGLPEDVQAEMDRRDPDWLYNGNWGVIQFAA